MDSFVQKLISVTPSESQLRWQEDGFYAFLHFGMNTFTGREWGDGRESPSLFAPARLDTDQWCESLALAGVRGCILTAKHHDGFCLWDTKQTSHSVMNSPYGRDIVAKLADSCRRKGLRLGLYLSPWDRHEPRYGQGAAYDDFFCAQLKELLTGYGELYALWFDGACGEGGNGKIQHYDWPRYYALIRQYQPGAVISVCGPDVRWCGNEAGDCRESEWSVVPASLRDNEKIAKDSQTADDDTFRAKRLSSSERDLGSRDVVRDCGPLCWYPAEVDTSIRPGWFYHEAEDEKVRPLEELANIYLGSVGGNAALLLNIPPNREGLIAEADRTRLRELGGFIRSLKSVPLGEGASYTAGSFAPGHEPDRARGENEECWMPSDESDSYAITLRFPEPREVRTVFLREQLRHSQRVEAFTLLDGEGRTVYSGTTIGCLKICRLRCRTGRLTLRIDRCRSVPAIRTFEAYYDNLETF